MSAEKNHRSFGDGNPFLDLDPIERIQREREQVELEEKTTRPVREHFPESTLSCIWNDNNIEKHSHFFFPFQQSKEEKLKKPRVLQISDDASISIEPNTTRHAFSYSTGLTYLALLLYWYENQTIDGTVECHFKDIVRLRGLNPNGGSSNKLIRHDIESLYKTIVAFHNSYEDDQGTYTSINHFQFLESLRYEKSKKGDKANFNRKIKLKFNHRITQQLLTGRINPVAYETLLTIENPMAGQWFRYIDSILSSSHKTGLARPYKSATVLEVLGIKGNTYSRPAKRRERLETIVKYCDGKKLSSGQIYRPSIRQKNGDYQLVSRGEGSVIKLDSKRPKVVNGDQQLVDELASEIATVLRERVTDYHRLLARTYSPALVRKVIADYRADVLNSPDYNPENAGAVFTTIFHRNAHMMGKPWIKDCGDDCEFRHA